MAFGVAVGGTWLEGFWWWVCASGQSTAPQKFALWQLANDGMGSLIGSATATSGALQAGQWNYVPLTAPVMLSVGAGYVASTGFNGPFPDTNNQFGGGEPYGAGIVNGPLMAFSDQSGSLPAPFSFSQGLFSVAGSDPTVYLAGEGANSANFWMDLQVTTQPPAGASYRIWPNYPTVPNQLSNDTGEQCFGTEFRLSQACALDNIWFYSPPGVSVLPSRCSIWDVANQTVVQGADNAAPSWSGPPGGGWVSCAFNGVTLPVGDYKTTVYYGGGQRFYTETVDYFSSGPGGNGIVAGPLTCPNVANAAACVGNSTGQPTTGNSTYQDGPFSYPDTFDVADGGETRWVDVEVTPVSVTTPPPVAVDAGAFLVFFP